MSAPALTLLYVPADWPVRVLEELGFLPSVVARMRGEGAV